MDNFNKKFKELRILNKMTQDEVATSLHLSRTTVAHYENGSRSPDIQKLILIAELFDVSLDFLVGTDKNV